jgi:hypothetical protein
LYFPNHCFSLQNFPFHLTEYYCSLIPTSQKEIWCKFRK